MTDAICRKCFHVHRKADRVQDYEYSLLRNCPKCGPRKRSPYWRIDP